jgi:hypothetical protein
MGLKVKRTAAIPKQGARELIKRPRGSAPHLKVSSLIPNSGPEANVAISLLSWTIVAVAIGQYPAENVSVLLLLLLRLIWHGQGVKIWSLISRLISTLAVVGLLIAPIAASSAAVAMAHMPVGAMGDMQSVSMPEGMPCCPDQGPTAPDQQKSCPLVISCMASSITIAPTVVASVLLPTKGHAIAPHNDMERDVLAQSPPLRPPRT